MSNKKSFVYQQFKFDKGELEDITVIEKLFTFSIVGSSLTCLFFLYKTWYKILRIKMKESYCTISVWINYLSMLNLSS